MLLLNHRAARFCKLVDPVELHSRAPYLNHGAGPQHWQEGLRRETALLRSGAQADPFRYDAAPIADGLAAQEFLDQMRSMNLDDQIHRYFGTSNLAAVPPQGLAAGIEHMKVDLGLTRDRGERFALWALLHTLGSAPDLDVAFKSEEEREAARNFMDLFQGESDS